jgi:hypothetical protein
MITNASDEEIERLNELVDGLRARNILLRQEKVNLPVLLQAAFRQERDNILSKCRNFVHECVDPEHAAARIYALMTPSSKACPIGCGQGMVLEEDVYCPDGSMEPDIPTVGMAHYRCQDCDLIEPVT